MWHLILIHKPIMVNEQYPQHTYHTIVDLETCQWSCIKKDFGIFFISIHYRTSIVAKVFYIFLEEDFQCPIMEIYQYPPHRTRFLEICALWKSERKLCHSHLLAYLAYPHHAKTLSYQQYFVNPSILKKTLASLLYPLLE